MFSHPRRPNDILERVPWIKSNDEYFQVEVNVGRSRLLLTKIAALLHDIAKPSTKKTDSAGKTRFLGHPEEGAEIAKSLMSRLKFSNRANVLNTYKPWPIWVSKSYFSNSYLLYRNK